MATRRQFLKQLGLGMAAGAAGWHVRPSPLLGWPLPGADATNLRVALLADAHLPDGNANAVPARNLMAAVAAINAQEPPVDLVFLAGDLTDQGGTEALFLGKAILSALHAPVWLVPGEKDRLAASGPLWEELFGDSTFSFSYQGAHFCGLNTVTLAPAAGEGFFQVKPQQYRWLAQELRHISLCSPLFLISHAPLYRLFQPWQWWTEQAESLYELLASRQNVLLLHGHVHQNVRLQYQNLTFQGLRATAWPLPDVRMGLTNYQPGQLAGKTGCGWMLLTINGNGAVQIADQVWET